MTVPLVLLPGMMCDARLFLPQIDSDLSLGPSLSGLISGGAFAGYCVAISASA